LIISQALTFVLTHANRAHARQLAEFSEAHIKRGARGRSPRRSRAHTALSGPPVKARNWRRGPDCARLLEQHCRGETAMTTMARGFWTSAPEPKASAVGMNARTTRPRWQARPGAQPDTKSHHQL